MPFFCKKKLMIQNIWKGKIHHDGHLSCATKWEWVLVNGSQICLVSWRHEKPKRNLKLLVGYDNKDCPGQVTYSVGQVKISVACPTGQGVIICFYWQYHISIQALDFESLWQFCGSPIATSVSFYIIKPTDFSDVACDWLASAVKPIRS